MNIRDLEYFVALAESRHFRRAAQLCNVSQPTLSSQIRKLEQELGVVLLERTSRKVLFTHTGLLLVEQARQILKEIKLLKEMAEKQTGEMMGSLYIGLIPTIAPYFLPYVIPILYDDFPQLECFWQEGKTAQLITLLEEGKIDCAIVASTKETERFIESTLYNEPMQLAIPAEHEWAARQTVQFSELTGKKLLMLEDGHCLREQTVEYCFHADIEEDARFKATSLETLRSMISMGKGMTLFPQLAISSTSMPTEKVCYIRCIEPELTRKVVLIYRPGSPLKARYEWLAKCISAQISPILLNVRDTKEYE